MKLLLFITKIKYEYSVFYMRSFISFYADFERLLNVLRAPEVYLVSISKDFIIAVQLVTRLCSAVNYIKNYND